MGDDDATSPLEPLANGLPFLGITALWALLIGGTYLTVAYGTGDGGDLARTGALLIPFVGYVGHTLQFAFASGLHDDGDD